MHEVVPKLYKPEPQVDSTYLILEGGVSMAPVGAAKRLSGDRCVHTAFLVSSSSFKLGVFHHCVTESSVAIFEHLTFFACFRLAGEHPDRG